MASLQPRPTCPDQFDVSAMAVGTAFTCGACGAVVTAGAAPAPSAASRMPPAPVGVGASGVHRAATASTVRSSSARGPQYVPVDRHREPQAHRRPGAESESGRRGRAGRAERGERGERGAPPKKKGLSPAALGGISLAGVAVVVVLVMMAANKDKGGNEKGNAKKDSSVAQGPSGDPSGTSSGDPSM